MAGLLVLGMISTRASSAGAILGALAAVATLAYAKLETDLSGLLYSAIGMATCILVGYLTSLILPAQRRDLAGLTIHSHT